MTTTAFAPSRAERFSDVFYLLLSGIFLTSLTLGNIVGVTKFVDLGLFVIPAGLLAYPITFLATDLMSEIYGKKRAQRLVWIGFVMNFFMLGLMGERTVAGGGRRSRQR